MNKKDTLVVTASLGNRITLDRTIKSIEKYSNSRVFHVIIAPENKCNEIRRKYPYLEVIEEPKSCKNIYEALNYGLNKFAKEYKYLTYINDDDYWLPNFIHLFDILDKDYLIDVAYGRVLFVDENDKFISEQASSSRYKVFKYLLSKNIILFTQQATLMKSELFIEMGGFDVNLKLISDTKFWLDAIDKKAKFKYINKICSVYTVQEGQLSSNTNLIYEEHKSLNLSNVNKNSLIVNYEVLLFRLSNIRIYINRFFKYRKFNKMWSFFHKE